MALYFASISLGSGFHFHDFLFLERVRSLVTARILHYGPLMLW